MSDLCLNTQQINNVGNLCEDPNTKGFDFEAGQSWIYPTNYPVRNYQYNIIQEALYKNTLVSLPTGLGKTFIAAVVMYNFYRWYPHGKVIFMAPTRPLVEQQIDACYNIMAIPPEVTAELTGVKKAQSSRAEVWQTKRVFFITPQVLQNDLENVLELGHQIKCLVFDEAHKAKGNYAYCEVIRRLLPKSKLFRVLALSATPGNSMKDIAEVMQNLLISHLEFRNEESNDVKEYVFQRSLETVVVPLGDKLQQVKEDYEQILESYARTLIKYKVVYGNFTNLTKGKIHMVKKEFQAKNRGSGTPHYAEIMKTLNICVTLYHGYEALIRCGLRIFLSYFEEHISNPLLSGNINLIQIIDDLRDYLGPSPEVQCLPDGSFAPISSSTKFGHPKFYRLRDILRSHFSNCDPSSRVIVFFEYKESVKEAYAILCQNYPVIKPRVFVGQGAGVRQKDQICTVRAFRQGNCNTLLSTCIGEEGLDVGEVDLIVCFDTTNKSPIRMIQRMGRTGRKKEGRIVVLVTEGKEQQTVKDSLICKNNLESVMTNSSHLEAAKYKDNPLMIPSYVKPQCQKLFITVKKPVLTKNSNIKDMFRSMASDSPRFSDGIEIIEIKERIKNKAEFLWNKADPLSCDFEELQINFSRHLEKQRAFQAFGAIKPSKQTEIFVHLLQSADSKRYNIPITQTSGGFNFFGEKKLLKQSDIRSMFTKNNNVDLNEVPCSLSSAIHNYEKEKELFPEELFQEITDYLLIRMTEDQECKTCTNLFKCPQFYYTQTNSIDMRSWVQPDLSILDTITAQDIDIFSESLSPQSKKLYQSLDSDDEIFEEVCFTQFEEMEEIKQLEEKSFAYETPKTFSKLMDSFRICENSDSQFDKPTSIKITTEKKMENIEDKKELSNVETHEEILQFFKLSSLEDLFVDDNHNESQDSSKTLIYTPEVIVARSDNSSDMFPSSEKKELLEEQESPILCSYERVERVKAKKVLFNENESLANESVKKPNLSKLKLSHKSFYESKRTPKKPSPKKGSVRSTDLDIADICDLSEFGINMQVLSERDNRTEKEKTPVKVVDLDISDVCDLSVFGLGNLQKKTNNDEKNKPVTKRAQTDSVVTDIESTKKITENELDIGDICDVSDFLGTPISKRSQNIETKSKVEVSTKNKELNDFCNIFDFLQPPTPVELKNSKIKTSSNETTKRKDKTSDIKDFCDISSFLNFESKLDNTVPRNNTPQKILSVRKSQPPDDVTKKSLFCFEDFEKPKKDKSTESQKSSRNDDEINEFDGDFSYFASTADTWISGKPKNKNKKEDIIDLTDSPEKPSKSTQFNKTTQISITQMLSLVSKSDDSKSKSTSQKENPSYASLKPKKISQKSALSLNNKKALSLTNNRKAMHQPKQNFNSPKSTQVQRINSTPTTKKKFNISVSMNSDDEFEECMTSPIFAKPKPVPVTSSVKKKIVEKPSTEKKKNRKKLFSDFIEDEAVLSDTDNVGVSEDEEDSDDDCFETSFVDDETQDILNATDMHAQYLKTTRSPSIRGKFKIPQKPRHNITNVFSQEVDCTDDTYLNDSFVVNTQDVIDSPPRHELSELELLEKKLKKMKKKSRKRKSDELSAINTKKRRLLVISDDSD